jgi:DNA-binding response OmpR family regulator
LRKKRIKLFWFVTTRIAMSRILIVEDHQTLLKSLSRGLQVLGHEVLVTETGEEGYSVALSQNVDLIILDVMLPGRSGFEILYELRQASFQQPVLILTARDTPEYRQRAAEVGASEFLAKPFSLEVFFQVLKRLLEGPTNPPSMRNES